MTLRKFGSAAGNLRRHPRLIAAVPSALALALVGASAQAEPVEFADDFSADSLRFTLDRRLDDRVERSYDVLSDRIVMRASATSEEERGRAELGTWVRSDSIRARVSLDTADLPVDPDASARVRIGGQLWNDTANGGFDERTGDVFVLLELRVRGDGSSGAEICVDRSNDSENSDSERVPLFENDDNCERFLDFVPELGVAYDLAIAVDRAEGVMTYSIDDEVRSVSLGQPVFIPFEDRREVQASHSGPPGETVATLYGVGTDEGYQDFAVDPPIIGPYRPFFDLQYAGRFLDVVDGRARLEVASSEGDDERVSLSLLGESDRIEASLELSSDSSLAAGSDDDDDRRLEMSLGGTFYNDTAEGGFNGDEGSVFATATLQQLADESLKILFCAYRSNTENFSDSLALLEQGDEECVDSGIDVALDTAYPVSLVLDRAAGTMTFAAADSEFIYPIATPIFSVEEGRQFIRARARALDGSTAVGFVDDYRTSADAPLVAAPGASDTGMEGGTVTGTGTNVDGVEGPITGDTPDEAGDGSTGDTDGEIAGQSSGGSSGGGGCSIGGRGGDGLTGLLLILAGAGLLARRRRVAMR